MEKESIATESTPLVLSEEDGYCGDDDDGDEFLSQTSTEAAGGLNLNMCSAWTHVFADTLRSVAVLFSAGFAYLFPRIISPFQADSLGAIVVSIIILLSLVPLVQGLFLTARKIQAIHGGDDDVVAMQLQV